MPHQPQLDRARAAMRLTAEITVDVDVLATAFSIHRGTLTRWMAHGRRGLDGHHIWLDGIFDISKDKWVSSAPAVERFLAQLPARGRKKAEARDTSEYRSPKSGTNSNDELINSKRETPGPSPPQRGCSA